MPSSDNRQNPRNASCQCGALRLLVRGDPDFVNICHCQFCQRRCGSAFSYNAYFVRQAVQISGNSFIFTRPGGEGRALQNHFCPTCGSTLFWYLDLRPNHIGVAVGAFNDRDFRRPLASLWEMSIYSWVTLPRRLQRHQFGLPAAAATKADSHHIGIDRPASKPRGSDS